MTKDIFHEYASYPALFWKLVKYKKVLQPQKISFGCHRTQYFLHFAPTGEARNKVVVYIHGGGWNNGSPEFFHFIGQKFAMEGYHCLMLGYRKAPVYRYPAQIEDVCKGYKTALSYLKKKGIDIRKVIVTGSSAGAHLGALLCCDMDLQQRFGINDKRIRGFVGLGGPYFFGGEHTLAFKYLVKGLFDRSCDWKNGEPYSKLSEVQQIPMLLIHSKHDGIVNYHNAVEFFNRAKQLGIKTAFYTVTDENDNHSSYSAGIFLEDRENSTTLDKLFDWIETI